MICFCGDSYVQDEAKPQSWTRMIASKLYLDEYIVNVKQSSKFIHNFAIGGKSIDHLIEEQLIKKVLPKYPQNPYEYLIIAVTHNERFDLYDNITFVGHHTKIEPYVEQLKQIQQFEKFDDELLYNYTKSHIELRLLSNDYYFERRKNIISSLITFFQKCGTKIFITNVSGSYDYYADKELYCEKKTINAYVDTYTNIEVYSNHFNVENNRRVAEAFYTEITNKYK